MSRLNPGSITDRTRFKHVAHKLVHLDETDSTNEAAWREAMNHAPSGTTIVTEQQTHGRGRFGRQWVSSPHQSLLMSILLRKDLTMDQLSMVNAVSALSGAQAIEDIAGLTVRIRFPNDLMVNDRKIGGILVESRLISNRVDFVVIGMGINVNVSSADFPSDIRPAATSLLIEGEKKFSRELLARKILQNMDHWLDILLGADMTSIRRAWHSYSSVVGQRVEIKNGKKTARGVVTDLDPVDGVILRMDNGLVQGFRGEHIQQLIVLRDQAE